MLMLFIVQSAVAADAVWMEDFEAAKAKAVAEGKDLLMDFTGSDWCHWCVKLKEEVFDHESFQTAAGKEFILLELDYPQDKEQSEAIKAQNAKLSAEYNIEGYPTILLADKTGAVYGRTGYQAGGPEAYLAHLQEFKVKKAARELALAEAMKLEGMDRVVKLGEVLNGLMEAQIDAGQQEIVDQIKALDPDDTKGFIDAFNFPKKLKVIEDGINQDKDFDKALQSLLDLVPMTTKKENLQHIYMFMAMIYMRGKQDEAQMMAHYKLAADANPESDLAKQIYAALEKQAAEAAALPAEGEEEVEAKVEEQKP
jgi:thioredoxin-related protein